MRTILYTKSDGFKYYNYRGRNKKVNADIKSKYKDVPWELMAAMRNKMVHNYDGIDTAVVLKTVKDDIPELKRLIEVILLNEHELLNDK